MPCTEHPRLAAVVGVDDAIRAGKRAAAAGRHEGENPVVVRQPVEIVLQETAVRHGQPVEVVDERPRGVEHNARRRMPGQAADRREVPPARHEAAEQLVQRVLGFADQGEIQEGIILQPLLFQHREVDAEGRYFDLRQGILDRLGDRHVAVNRREAGVDDDQVGLLLPDVAEHIVDAKSSTFPSTRRTEPRRLAMAAKVAREMGGQAAAQDDAFCMHRPSRMNFCWARSVGFRR